jgi:hypothetical protein
LRVLLASKCQKHTTPSFQHPVKSVTVTHPFHPLCGRQVEVVRIRQGTDPDIVVRHPDGFPIAIATSWTDYAVPPDPESPSTPSHLLDFGGLCQAAQLVDHIRREGRYPAVDDGDQPCATSGDGYD